MKKSWRNSGLETINVIGKVGGLAILWNPTVVNIQIFSCDSRSCITVRVECIQSKFSFFLSNIYAPNMQGERRKF